MLDTAGHALKRTPVREEAHVPAVLHLENAGNVGMCKEETGRIGGSLILIWHPTDVIHCFTLYLYQCLCMSSALYVFPSDMSVFLIQVPKLIKITWIIDLYLFHVHINVLNIKGTAQYFIQGVSTVESCQCTPNSTKKIKFCCKWDQ